MKKTDALKAITEALKIVRNEKQKQNAPGLNNHSIDLSRLITELLLLENAISQCHADNLLIQMKKT